MAPATWLSMISASRKASPSNGCAHNGSSRRAGSWWTSGSARPFGQVYPSETGWSGSPVTRTTRSPSTCTTMPHIAWHIRQKLRTVSTAGNLLRNRARRRCRQLLPQGELLGLARRRLGQGLLHHEPLRPERLGHPQRFEMGPQAVERRGLASGRDDHGADLLPDP